MEDFLPLVLRVQEKLGARGWRISTAESCTGGLLSAALTHPPGASSTYERGFVTYSNTAKAEDLMVPFGLLEQFGAVSAEVAAAMAEGCLRRGNTQLALSITGIAGPTGGTTAKPVGLVYFGCAVVGRSVTVVEHRFGAGPRAAIRSASVRAALALAEEALDQALA